jgi:hypothetical protein
MNGGATGETEVAWMTAAPALLDRHLAHLRDGSGIDPEVIAERGARSIENPAELVRAGFGSQQRRVPGLLLPVWSPDGSNGLYQYRPDSPRTDARGRAVKYETPLSAGLRLDCPPRCRPALADPTVTLWVTEGIKKADALASRGLCALALLGVWNFKGRNDLGGVTLLADWDYVALKGRDVRLTFDSDAATVPEVRKALERLTEHLRRKGAVVTVVALPVGPGGAKIGVDDYLVGHSVDELQALARVPREATKAPQPTVELLDAMPGSLAQPLALIDERAYAATWLPVQERTDVYLDPKSGELVRYAEPRIVLDRRLFVVRDDGRLFGDGGDESLAALGLEVRLSDPPRQERLWRTPAVKAYRAGVRPDPAGVFRRVAGVYDRFIDFSRSVAEQPAMCELSACFSLATWLRPAFTVLGYPWPNGDRGAGKTNWGICWAMTSYLGEVILASGSFAALRDLAQYGAALLFDDAESLSDPKKCDPDKRALLLAGNRRGAEIPLKESVGDRWVTRWVSAFCPRGFTAIKLPDSVLASRSIVIPLVRTGDPRRGNADPADAKRWPCDQRQLQDDLWATALSLLPDAERCWVELEEETDVIGREFEPWRAVIAVARLFDRLGVAGLEQRIRDVMSAHREERPGADEGDWTGDTICALLELLAGRDVRDIRDVGDITSEAIDIGAEHVVEQLKLRASDLDTDATWATSRRVGRLLGRLRYRQAPGRSKGRRWHIPREMTVAVARSYGLLNLGARTDGDAPSLPNVPAVPNVPNVPLVACAPELHDLGETLLAEAAAAGWPRIDDRTPGCVVGASVTIRQACWRRWVAAAPSVGVLDAAWQHVDRIKHSAPAAAAG